MPDSYSDFAEMFERWHGQRPAEPNANNEDPERWAEIADWEWKRAEAIWNHYGAGKDLATSITSL